MSNLRILKHFKTTFSGKYFKGTFEILLKTPISNYIHKKKKMPICFLHFSDEKKNVLIKISSTTIHKHKLIRF